MQSGGRRSDGSFLLSHRQSGSGLVAERIFPLDIRRQRGTCPHRWRTTRRADRLNLMSGFRHRLALNDSPLRPRQCRKNPGTGIACPASVSCSWSPSPAMNGPDSPRGTERQTRHSGSAFSRNPGFPHTRLLLTTKQRTGLQEVRRNSVIDVSSTPPYFRSTNHSRLFRDDPQGSARSSRSEDQKRSPWFSSIFSCTGD